MAEILNIQAENMDVSNNSDANWLLEEADILLDGKWDGKWFQSNRDMGVRCPNNWTERKVSKRNQKRQIQVSIVPDTTIRIWSISDLRDSGSNRDSNLQPLAMDLLLVSNLKFISQFYVFVIPIASYVTFCKTYKI